MMVELVSSLGGDYIAPGLSFASFALSEPITVITAHSLRFQRPEAEVERSMAPHSVDHLSSSDGLCSPTSIYIPRGQGQGWWHVSCGCIACG